tara:strand:- start:142 stop:453 length:312 start_codon:yes stop_codon:yes gene_type:complete
VQAHPSTLNTFSYFAETQKKIILDAESMTRKREKWETLKIETPPLYIWPPKLLPLVKYIFGHAGYFLHRNICYMPIALFTWFFLTPSLLAIKTFQRDEKKLMD